MELLIFKNEPKKTPFAPEWFYPIAYGRLIGIDFNKIAQIILKKEKQIISSTSPVFDTGVTDGYTGLGSKSLTSRYNHFNVLLWKETEIQKLSKVILDFHSKYLKALNIRFDHELKIRCWANVMRKNETISPHCHSVNSDAYLSGHISVQCGKTATHYMTTANHINDAPKRSIPNEVGQITLFPTCMPHYTDTHKGKKERITIAFDIYAA